MRVPVTVIYGVLKFANEMGVPVKMPWPWKL